jgi:hypothetical protein
MDTQIQPLFTDFSILVRAEQRPTLVRFVQRKAHCGIPFARVDVPDRCAPHGHRPEVGRDLNLVHLATKLAHRVLARTLDVPEEIARGLLDDAQLERYQKWKLKVLASKGKQELS